MNLKPQINQTYELAMPSVVLSVHLLVRKSTRTFTIIMRIAITKPTKVRTTRSVKGYTYGDFHYTLWTLLSRNWLYQSRMHIHIHDKRAQEETVKSILDQEPIGRNEDCV